MQPIYFSKAGKFKLRKYKNGVPSTDAADCYFRNGAIQSLVPSVNINTATLPDGNSDWDAAEPDTGTKIRYFTFQRSFRDRKVCCDMILA